MGEGEPYDLRFFVPRLSLSHLHDFEMGEGEPYDLRFFVPRLSLSHLHDFENLRAHIIII
jgi:hypothetical protein